MVRVQMLMYGLSLYPAGIVTRCTTNHMSYNPDMPLAWREPSLMVTSVSPLAPSPLLLVPCPHLILAPSKRADRVISTPDAYSNYPKRKRYTVIVSPEEEIL